MKPNPCTSMDVAIRSGDCSSPIPSSSSTSAEPQAELAARFPCFATAAPAAAATSAAAVEMLKVRAPSPPVPTTSTSGVRDGVTRTTCSDIASAKPVISSAVSPFALSATRRSRIWSGVASPLITIPITERACSRVRSRRSVIAMIAVSIT